MVDFSLKCTRGSRRRHRLSPSLLQLNSCLPVIPKWSGPLIKLHRSTLVRFESAFSDRTLLEANDAINVEIAGHDEPSLPNVQADGAATKQITPLKRTFHVCNAPLERTFRLIPQNSPPPLPEVRYPCTIYGALPNHDHRLRLLTRIDSHHHDRPEAIALACPACACFLQS